MAKSSLVLFLFSMGSYNNMHIQTDAKRDTCLFLCWLCNPSIDVWLFFTWMLLGQVSSFLLLCYGISWVWEVLPAPLRDEHTHKNTPAGKKLHVWASCCHFANTSERTHLWHCSKRNRLGMLIPMSSDLEWKAVMGINQRFVLGVATKLSFILSMESTSLSSFFIINICTLP